MPYGSRSAIESLQQGYGFVQDARLAHQREKANDYELKDLGRENADKEAWTMRGANKIRMEGGTPEDTFDASSTEMGDPLIMRFGQWAKDKLTGGRKTALPSTPDPSGFAAPPAPAMAAYAPEDAMDYQVSGFADGGDVDSPENIRNRAERSRTNRPGSVINQTETVKGADRSVKPSVGDRVKGAGKALKPAQSLPSPAGSGALARGARAVGRTAIPAAIGMAGYGAMKSAMSDEARMADDDEWPRKGSEGGTDALTDPAFYRDMGDRAGHALRGAVNTFLPESMEIGRKGALPVSPPAASSPSPAPAAIPSPGGSGRYSAGASLQQRQALPTATQGPPKPEEDLLSQVDFSQTDPNEIPSMGTDDWKQYRMDALQSAMQRGVSYVDALEKTDAQITRMQQAGFLKHAQQGFAAQQAGNVRGAMAQYKAAYQYFPNGHDTKLGLHDGQIVGVGMNEKTGEPIKGTEMILSPESVASIIENFSNPSAYRQATTDWRSFQQRERMYQEVTKPGAESEARYRQSSAEAAQTNAASLADFRASGGASGAGGSQSGAMLRDSMTRAQTRLEEISLEDPQMGDELNAIIAEAQRRNPEVSAPEIMLRVLTRAGVYDDTAE